MTNELGTQISRRPHGFVGVSRMIRSEGPDCDLPEEEEDSFERMNRSERTVYPCRNGTPKRSRFKKGTKRIRMNGKHRRRVRKVDW